MSSAGRSGASDTERTNFPGGPGMPADMSSAPGAGGPLMPGETAPDEPIEMVEIIEVEDEAGEAPGMGPGGFQWWYVPAIGMPVVVGAGAAIWYLTKGAEPYTNAWELVTRPVRTLTGQPKMSKRTRRATRKAGKTSDTLRGRMTGALAGLDASDLTGKASDLWEDARDSMVDLWDQITDRDTLSQARVASGIARDAAQRQLGQLVAAVAAASAALAIQQRMNDVTRAARERAQAVRTSTQAMPGRMPSPPWLARNQAQAQAKARAMKANAKRQMAKTSPQAVKVKSQRTAKRARQNVTAPFRRLRVFAFAALITAMVIYVRSWYVRRGPMARFGTTDTGDMRETAGGRMESGTWPRFADRPADAAAPTAANAPTEPS